MTDQNPVSQDEYLVAVGKVVQGATTIDLYVFNVFFHMSGCLLKVARAIYHAPDAFAVKEKMIRRIAKEVADEEEKKIVNSLIEFAKIANSKRNELAHAMIVTADMESGKFTRFQPKEATQPHRPVTHEYLKSILEPIGAALQEAAAAHVRFCEKRQISHQLYA